MTATIITRDEVAELLRTTIENVDVLARRGDLPSFFIGDGRCRRFHVDDIAAFVEARRARGAAVPT